MHWSDFFLIGKRIGSRYFMLAGFSFIFFYLLFRKKIFFKKIQNRYPKWRDYAREIGFSICTIFIFALSVILIVKNPAVVPYTNYYTDIHQHGWFYFFLAFPLMFFIHDAYFYWMHRLMHHKKLFKLFHLVHHKSTNPSPWAAYAFHPLEAVVEAGILPVFVFTLPIHPLHLLIFFFMMIAYNVYGHLGYELYPKGFNKHWFGKWINTSISHNQHHQFFRGNYGLYTTIWDRMFGTLRDDYDRQFDEVKSRRLVPAD
ncbi:MAG: sterol desaturase [Bacteroidetes bacterium]|nr:MAG: sterol desaturase [Bacteroidota bacterium]